MRSLFIVCFVLLLTLGTEGTLAAEEERPPAGPFGPAGSLGEARADHTATLLPDGRVLVVGGQTLEPLPAGKSPLGQAEVWDPVTGSFGPTGSLGEARADHTATLLPDGRVLVVGGYGEDGYSDNLASAEVWDPATASFAPTGPLTAARDGHTATLLSDGRVLVIGGWGDDRPASAEVWDTVTEAFALAGSLAEARQDHTATLLSDGRVLVIGGYGEDGSSFDGLASAEVWDPVTASFTHAGSIAEARTSHTATLLRDGRVLVVGGCCDDDRLSSAEVWDPATASFAPMGSLTAARDSHTATLLPDGRVLVVGGWPLFRGEASAEVWDPATEAFAPAGSLAEARQDHTATLLPDGRVLVVGGKGFEDSFTSAEVWDPRVTVVRDTDQYVAMIIAVEPYREWPMENLLLNLSMSPDRWERDFMARQRDALDQTLARLDAVDVRECFELAHWALRSGTQAMGVGLDMVLDHQDEAGKSVVAAGFALVLEGQQAAEAAAEPCGYLPPPE